MQTCGCGHELARLEIHLDGDELELVSCRACDASEWRREGNVIELADVELALESAGRSTKP
jgi:hypothetical protein